MECLACCLHLASDEYRCPNNHQPLCLECLLHWVERRHTCPVCREEYEVIPTPNDAWGGLLNIFQESLIFHINREARNGILERLASELINLNEMIHEAILYDPTGFQLNIEAPFYQIQVYGGAWNHGRQDSTDDDNNDDNNDYTDDRSDDEEDPEEDDSIISLMRTI
jgi:hypothetical protein